MNVVLVTEPNTLSPMNAPVWFDSTGDWSNVQNYKFIYNVREIQTPSSSVVKTDLGTYRIPPSPSGNGYFSPNKILRTRFSYPPVPYLGGWTNSDNYMVKYNVKYGFESDLVLDYYDEYFDAGNVGLTFSYPHNLVANQNIKITTNGTLNPSYNTDAVVLTAPNPYYVRTNIPWGSSGPVLGGTVQITYYQTIQFITGQGTLGIDFNGPHFFQIGDIITIDKEDKSENIEYDGAATVVSTTTYSIALNKEWNGTASETDGGLISRIQRIVGTSSILYGYNGTREYNELNRDFGLSYSINASTITTNGATAAGFLTNYSGWKEVPLGYTETAQAFVSSASGLIRYKIKTFNSNMVQLLTGEVIFTPTYTRTYTFGVGPEDVKTIFGSSILNGATYYQVYLDTISDS